MARTSPALSARKHAAFQFYAALFAVLGLSLFPRPVARSTDAAGSVAGTLRLRAAPSTHALVGLASYYHPSLRGLLTSARVPYDENALTAAEGINRAMLAEQFPNIVESDWVRLRNGLNQLAVSFTLAPISTTRVSYARAARDEAIARPQNQVLLENLHESTRRFKDRFDDAVGKYTAPTDRSKFAKDTANALQDSTGRLVEDFKDNKARPFRQNLQDTFVVAAAMNRIMLGNQFSSTLKAQWSEIRNDLNRVARVYGQPLLPDRISPLYQPYQPLLTD